MLSCTQLQQIIPQNKSQAQWLTALNELLPKYEINTSNRVACFLAQCVHESREFTVLKENLYYTAKGLLKTFPRYFTPEQAEQYDRRPQKIANRVYANRMGNGSEQSNDGYQYSGRGVIQLTGKNNYTKFAVAVNKTLDETAEYLTTVPGALESACWFWKINNLNALADTEDMQAITKKINGGTIGLAERLALYKKIKGVV